MEIKIFCQLMVIAGLSLGLLFWYGRWFGFSFICFAVAGSFYMVGKYDD